MCLSNYSIGMNHSFRMNRSFTRRVVCPRSRGDFAFLATASEKNTRFFKVGEHDLHDATSCGIFSEFCTHRLHQTENVFEYWVVLEL